MVATVPGPARSTNRLHPRPVAAQRRLDGAEAGEPRRLAQRREPAGAEVDRVQLQAEGRSQLGVDAPLDLGRRHRRRRLERRCIAVERVLDDAHVGGHGRDA
jgi:hypothetical protein